MGEWFVIIILMLASFLLGLLLGKKENRLQNCWNWMLGNLEKIIMMIFGGIVLVCLVASIVFDIEETSILVLNVLSTLVFSWLLTKISAEKDFKKKEEELAKLCHRQICDIDSGVLAVNQKIKDYVSSDKEISERTRYLLDGITDHINYIEGSIVTNQKAWHDMLSKEYQKELSDKEDPEATAIDTNLDYKVFQPFYMNEGVFQDINTPNIDIK